MDNILSEISRQPFLIAFYFIGLLNFIQGLYYSFKYLNGYGTVFTWKQFLKVAISGKRMVGTFPKLIGPLDKPKKDQRDTLLIYAILMFLSVFILFLIVKGI